MPIRSPPRRIDAGVDSQPAEFLDARLGEVVSRQPRDEGGVVPPLRQRDRDVRLAAAEGHLEVVRLVEPQMAGRRQADHDLAERDSSHRKSVPGSCVGRSIRTLTG